MNTPLPKPDVDAALQEWLENGPRRSEFINGVVSLERTWHSITMQSTSWIHSRACFLLAQALNTVLDKKRCIPLAEGTRVYTSDTIYRLPDVVVACRQHNENATTNSSTLQPSLVAEVLSPATVSTDHGDKLREYMSLDFISYYLIVDPDAYTLIVYERTDNKIMRSDVAAKDGSIELPKLSMTLSLEFLDQLEADASLFDEE